MAIIYDMVIILRYSSSDSIYKHYQLNSADPGIPWHLSIHCNKKKTEMCWDSWMLQSLACHGTAPVRRWGSTEIFHGCVDDLLISAT